MVWYGMVGKGVSRYLPSGGDLPPATKRLSFPRGDRIYIAMLSVKKDDNGKQNIDKDQDGEKNTTNNKDQDQDQSKDVQWTGLLLQ